MATVSLLCPACGAALHVEAPTLSPRCACGVRVELRPGGGFEGGGPIERCAVCNSEALHIAKDFNKNLGVAMVALGCIGFWWGAMAGVASLTALTVLDRVVYRLRPMVTVCYACKSIYRGAAANPRHLPYELTFDETFEGTGETPRFER